MKGTALIRKQVSFSVCVGGCANGGGGSGGGIVVEELLQFRNYFIKLHIYLCIYLF
jgi:hypothetical protein